MHDPGPDTPTTALIGHIRTRYHDAHRRELPDLIALARKVEAAHATDPNVPHGLAGALEDIRADLERHMREEEDVVFPALRAGSAAPPAGALPALRAEHDGQEAAVNRIAAIAHGFRLPNHACQSWRRLNAGLRKLVEDLDDHRHLEDEVLFPRFERQG